MNKLKKFSILIAILSLLFSYFNLKSKAIYTMISETNAVSRFYDSNIGAHFFTASKFESDYIKANDSRWSFENKTFKVIDYKYSDYYKANQCAISYQVNPVYRFYRPSTMTHFYTMDESEKNNIIANDSSWSFEGVAYCAFNNASEEFSYYDLVPLYRFYRESTRTHFYTIDESEKGSIINNDSSWKFEGTAFFVSRMSSIYDALKNNKLNDYSKFIEAVDIAGLTDILKTRKNITVFPFPNIVITTYQNENPEKWEQMISNPDKSELKLFILNHIYDGEILYNELASKTELLMMGKASFPLTYDQEMGVLIDNTPLYGANTPYVNGYTHYIEHILIP